MAGKSQMALNRALIRHDSKGPTPLNLMNPHQIENKSFFFHQAPRIILEVIVENVNKTPYLKTRGDNITPSRWCHEKNPTHFNVKERKC